MDDYEKEYLDHYNDLTNDYAKLNDERDFNDDIDMYNSRLNLSDEDMEELLNLSKDAEEDDDDEEDNNTEDIDDNDAEDRNLQNDEESQNQNEEVKTDTPKNIYSKDFLKQTIEKAKQEKNLQQNANTYNPKSSNQSNDINNIVNRIVNSTETPLYYKINYLNLHKCIFELRADKNKEWSIFLKENYEGELLEQLYGMTTFTTVNRYYEEDKRTVKKDVPVITPEFVIAINNFYKKDNFILIPIYDKEDLVEEDIYISMQTKQFYWYKKNKKGNLYISIFKVPIEKFKKRDYYNSLNTKSFELFVSFELAKYCYNDNGRLTLYPKNYTPKYILDENVLFIKEYISDTDKITELYKL
jgi:hypothetical protein